MMDAIYNDLDNYDDVDAVNRLKVENSELKHKLEGCHMTIKKLQEDFDNLEVEFKRLETSYSSLLKISRAEIQRKTTMITNLNIEKDLLVIKALQGGRPHKVQKLLKNVREVTEDRWKNKNRNKVEGKKGKGQQESLRRNSGRPPSSSSTATDNSNKVTGSERVTDNNISIRTNTQEIEPQYHEMFPDNQPSTPLTDKRLSGLSALNRHQLAKLSSDEEFEDMYSALKPKASREPDRNRKRGRDDSQEGKQLYNNSHSRPHNDPLRNQFKRNKSGRFSDNERNINRDHQHNESDRSTNRGKQYNNDRSRNVNDSQYKKFSPERHRRGPKEHGDDRYRNKRPESPPRGKQRLGSPEREKHQFKKISERRKSYHGRDREYRESDALGHNYPETTIHGAYGEPLNKKPRMEPYPVHQEEKIASEKQCDNDSRSPGIGNRTCQSPDFSHTEESSNEPLAAHSDIRTTTCPVFEDPRRNSKLYVKCTAGSGDILQSANANKIYLQPVDKSLWNLQEVQVPKASASKPVEISEEHVDKMDIGKPLSNASLESGEIGSETNDTALDNIYDFREFNQQNCNDVYNVNESRKIEDKNQKENSPLYKQMPNDIRHEKNVLKNESRTQRSEKANNHRSDELLTSTCKSSHKGDAKTQHDNTQIPSILQKLIHSMNEIRPHGGDTEKSSQNEEETEPKGIVEPRMSNKIEKAGSKVKDKFKPKINLDNFEKITEKNKEIEPKHISEMITSNKLEKSSKNEEETEPKGIAEPRMSNKIEKAGSKVKDKFKPKINLDNFEKITEKNKEIEPKHISEMITSNKLEKSSLRQRELECKKVSKFKTTGELDKESANNKEKEVDKIGTSKVSDKNTKLIIKTVDDTELIDSKKMSEPKNRKKSEKVIKNYTENEPERIAEPRTSVRVEKASSKPREVGHKHVSKLKTKDKLENETENNVTIFREFEHRVYSRHIVEGDLELSDESNDDTLHKIGEKIEKIKNITPKRKSHAPKDKKVNSEDTKRKTRSQKNKERKSINKFSELFGDSSSLITPEDLNLATRTAHGLPVDCCPPAAEDARDSIFETEVPLETQTTKLKHQSDFKTGLVEPTIVEGKSKHKESVTRTKYKQNQDLEGEQVSNTYKEISKQVHSEVKEPAFTRTESHSVSEENLVSFNDQLTQVQTAKISNDMNENDATPNEIPKDSLNSNKRPKTKGEKKLSPRELTDESHANKMYTSSEINPNNTLTMNDNKENTSSNGNPEGNIGNEMSRIFENTIVPTKLSSDVSEISKDIPQLIESTKVPICNIGAEDVPNLGPVTEKTGLVKTVVISSGIQPSNSNSVQYSAAFNALASSTPAKDLSTINISSELEPNMNNSTQISVTIARDDSVSQPEADVPDMRITCHRRRRKVLKR